ncbi:hypothetical protein Ancab_007393 [Ancistrocladus abbreviatus]
MNPLTLVKRIQKINSKEADLGISEEASWHAKYKDSAYVFVGGVPYDLTEGDLLAVFAQYGEIVDVNLVRDKGTGKSKGFAFIAYEDQRSTNLAVDNLNGAQILGRIIRVDHVNDYKRKEEEDEEAQRQKREARGVCRAFQRGECNRGAGCKFSHDEQRAANTGWGHQEDRSSRWGHDKFDDRVIRDKRSNNFLSNQVPESRAPERHSIDDHEERGPRGKGNMESRHKQSEIDSSYQDRRDKDRLLELRVKTDRKEDQERHTAEKRSSRYEPESNSREEHDKREDKRSRRHDVDTYRRGNGDERERERQKEREGERRRHDRDTNMRGSRDERDREREKDKERERMLSHTRDSSSHHHRSREDDDYYRSRR